MSYVVAIPSYKRAETLRDKTLATLQYNKISPKKIYIFVADAEEKKIYENVLSPNSYNKLIVGILGIGNIHNFITEYFPIGKEIFKIDDDIKSFKKINTEKKLEIISNLDKLIKDGFKLSKETGYRLWGFYPVANGFFMKDRIETNLHLITSTACGIINPGIDVLKLTLNDKEDSQRSIIMYLLDGGVIRFDNICYATNYYKEPGGMQVERTKERVLKSAEAIVKSFPDLATLNLTKKSGYAEIRLKDKRKLKTFSYLILERYSVPKVD